jgi:hypothetical protein
MNKKIISFSLYGNDNKYINGMKRNIELIPQIYGDEWNIRIYLNDSVGEENIDYFKSQNNVEVVDMTGKNIPGMFWRFIPFVDKSVDIFCVRDADSRPSIREKAAVDEWLQEGTSLHVMRDHPHHNYVVMGGMFDFNKVNGTFDFIREYNNFVYDGYKFTKMDDMVFLQKLYQKFFMSVTDHDSYARSSCDNNGSHFLTKSKPYPIQRKDKSEGFIGEIFNEDDTYEYHRSLL